jgi:hypothetical protein
MRSSAAGAADRSLRRRRTGMAGRADGSLSGSDARSGPTESATQDRLRPDARIGLEARDDL